MSIKNLFDNRKENRETLTSDAFVTASKDVESQEHIIAKNYEHDRYVPHFDYATASNFAKFGSAELYYETAFKRIYNQYPYDGTLAEKTEFQNSSSYFDKYVFDNVYPRTNGFISMSVGGWGAVATANNFPTPSTQEYITIQGGPHTASAGMATIANSFSASMVYDLANKRGSSLALDLESSGSTVEFWLKRGAFSTAPSVKNEVIFDLSNGGTYSSEEQSRLILYLVSGSSTSTTPFKMTIMSGAAGDATTAQTLNIGSSADISQATLIDGTWRHFALTLKGNQAKFYVNGHLSTQTTLGATYGDSTGSLNARIGALQSPIGGLFEAGGGKLAAAMDDFRYWKTERTGREIKNNFFIPIGGGTNNFTSNKDLGVYLKFNEGITQTASVDSTVLDYSGRIANGIWTGYTAAARNTGSAMYESGYAQSEFKDPIIYSYHPDVSAELTKHKASGSVHDLENSSMFYNLYPSWVTEEDTENGKNLKYLSQIMASYFDTLYAQIWAVKTLKDESYPSSSYKAIPFIDKLLQDRGFAVGEGFLDASVSEKFLNANDQLTFEKSIDEAKKLIYHNIYNNLTYIYKSKGTEKSFRNLLHCYGIDSRLVKLNLYADDATFVFKDNYEDTTAEHRYVNFNNTGSFEATIYQASSSVDADSRGFIKGNESAISSSYTVEAEIIFPKLLERYQKGYFDRPFTQVSLFGFHSVDGTTEEPHFIANDHNINVYAIKPSVDSADVKFKIDGDFFTAAETSYYKNVYDNSKWNFAIRVYHDKYPLVGGPHGPAPSTKPKGVKKIELYGINTVGSTVLNEFTISSTSTRDEYFTDSRRIYAGANRTNFTGSVLHKTDVKVSNVRYWTSRLDDETIRSHAFDPGNYGVRYPDRADNIFQNLDGDASNITITNVHLPHIDTLALHWDFSQITSSYADGTFEALDISSGSAAYTSLYGSWASTAIKHKHGCKGDYFPANHTKAVDKEFIYTSKQRQPETVYSSDMVTIKTDDNEFSFEDPDVSDNFYAFEKSMYSVISDEMLKMFATIVDFNNLVGEPVHRYREGYKGLDFLRHLFFQKVQNEPDIDKFIDFYKWIDGSFAKALQQLHPASARFSDGVGNIIESHILERNKVRQVLPTLARYTTTEGSVKGQAEMNYNWEFGHAPLGVAKATATIVISDSGGISHGDTFVLVDFAGLSTTYTINGGVASSSGGGSGGAATVGFSGVGGGSAGKIAGAAAIATAINATTDANYTAVSNGVDTVTITQSWFGIEGNKTNSDSISSTVVSNFTGGDGKDNTNCLWQKDRREAGVGDHNTGRGTLRQVIGNHNAAQAPTLIDNGTTYAGSTYALRSLSKPYRLNTELSQHLHSGINYAAGKDRNMFRQSTSIHGKAGEVTGIPDNVVAIGADFNEGSGLVSFPACGDNPATHLNKMKYASRAVNGHFGNHDYKGVMKGEMILPFNLHSGTMTSDYNAEIASNVQSNVVLTNMHSDTYSPSNEIGMQGPFTDAHVGGHQHRHVRLNSYDPTATTQSELQYVSTPAAAATAQVVITYATLAQGDTLTIQDNDGTTQAFEFIDASSTAAPNIAYGDDIGATAINLRNQIQTALDVTVTPGTGGGNITLALAQNDTGTSGNSRALSSTASHMSITAWANGTNDSYSVLYRQLDDLNNRPEAFGILTGDVDYSDGALGVVGPDYGGSYPATHKHLAIRFRDEHAKRPVNLRNIQHNTSSVTMGNFQHNYEVVNTSGRFVNNLALRDHQGTIDYLPTTINTALPKTTHPYSLLSQRPTTQGNIFGEYDSNRFYDIAGVAAAKATGGSFKAFGRRYYTNGYYFTLGTQKFEVDQAGDGAAHVGSIVIASASTDTAFWNNIKTALTSYGYASTITDNRVNKQAYYQQATAGGMYYANSPQAFNVQTAFTWCAWIKPTGGNSGQTNFFFHFLNSSNQEVARYRYEASDGTIRFWIRTQGGDWRYWRTADLSNAYFATSGGGDPPGWFHLCLVFDGGSDGIHTADCAMYINGAAISLTISGEDPGDPPNANDGKAYFFINHGGDNTTHFEGHMDEMMWFKRELSATDVLRVYNSGYGFDPTAADDINGAPNYWWTMGDHGSDANGAALVYESVSGLNLTKTTTTNFTLATGMQQRGYATIAVEAAAVGAQWNTTIASETTDLSFDGTLQDGFAPTSANIAGGVDAVTEETNIYATPLTTLGDGTSNKTVITSRFSAPGGHEVSHGYLDAYSRELSVYNAMPYRNLTVLGESSGEADTIRVNDGLGYRRGLRQLLTQHCGKHGLDSEYGSPIATYFNGVSSAVSIGSAATWNAILGGTSKMSFSFWIQANDITNLGRIIDFGDSDISIYVDGDRLYFKAKFTGGSTDPDPGWWVAQAYAIIAGSNWYHVVITFDSSSDGNNPIMYTNGAKRVVTETNAPDGTGVPIATEACYIGNDAGLDKAFDGQIDEMAIWTRILDAGEAEKIYNAGRADTLYATGLDSDVQAWWRLGDGLDVPLKIHDVSGNGRHGIGQDLTFIEYDTSKGSFHKTHRNTGRKLAVSSSTGFPKINYDHDNFFVSHPIPRSDFQYSWINASLGHNYNVESGQQEIFGHAPANGEIETEKKVLEYAEFNGTDSYIYVPNTVANWNNIIGSGGTNLFSISMWIKPNDLTPTTRYAIALSGLTGFAIGVNNGGSLLFTAKHTNAETWATATSTIATNTWYHIVISYNGSGGAPTGGYVNNAGTAATLATSPVAGSFSIGTSGLAIGNLLAGWTNPTLAPFDGWVDDVMIFNRTLTAAEVNTIYSNGQAGGDIGTITADGSLVAHYPLGSAKYGLPESGDDSKSSIKDVSGNGRNATLVNNIKLIKEMTSRTVPAITFPTISELGE